MRKIKEVKINDELTLKAFEDKEWNEFKILAFVNGEQIKENDDDASKAFSCFEDDKEAILGTLEAEVKFFKANPEYHKKWITETKEDDDEFEDLDITPEDYNQEGIDEEGTVSGIVCNKCGNELPEHTVKDHLDKNHPVHKCPHQLTDQTFLSNTELSDLPENLNQAGFKNVFIIDENTDFSKLPNPFLKK